MSRTPERTFPKMKISLSIDSDLIDMVKHDLRITNLSSHVEDLLRSDARLRLKKEILECRCGVAGSALFWAKMGCKCPHCHQDHNITDNRRTVEL